MNEKHKLILTVTLTLVGISCITILAILVQNKNAAPIVKYSPTSSLDSTDSTASKSTNNGGINLQNNANTGTLGVSDSGSGRTSDNADTNKQQSSSDSTVIAGQDTFSQYNQYADKTEIYYQDISVGNGVSAELQKQVSINYKGWLTDGRLFDQSGKNEQGEPQPFIFTIGSGNVISGIDMGVNGMKVGGKRRIIIPPSLGYGNTGNGSLIPPNAVLIFDIELSAVQ